MRKPLGLAESARRYTIRGQRSIFTRPDMLMAIVIVSKASGSTEQFQRAASPQQNSGRANHQTPKTSTQSSISAGKTEIPCQCPSAGPLPFFAPLRVLLTSDLVQTCRNKVSVRPLNVPQCWQQFCFLAFCVTLQMSAACSNVSSLFLDEIPSSLHCTVI